MTPRRRHWLAALAIATGVHLVLGWALATQWSAPSAGNGGAPGPLAFRLAPTGPGSRGPTLEALPDPPSSRPQPAAAAQTRRAVPRPERIREATPAVAPEAPPQTAALATPSRATETAAGPVDDPAPSLPAVGAAAGSGSGGGDEAGGSNGVGDPYLARVHDALRRTAVRHYPSRAQRDGQEGTVQLWVRVARDGGIVECEIQTSSGSRRLDRAALRACRRTPSAGPVPPQIPEPALRFRFDMDYVLQTAS
ncbi:MAG: TonB family protein [Proteobacteria bacterium]|nr:TonB family protein [Pseudomonadota bacterium]